MLREENDVDGKFDANLFDHVIGLEETQLQLSLNYNKEHGISTEALERRMAELASQKTSDDSWGAVFGNGFNDVGAGGWY